MLYWPGYYNDIRTWCQTCASCATRKQPPMARKARLGIILASYPPEIMAMDILGPESDRKNSYILICLPNGWRHFPSQTKRLVLYL